MRGIFLHKGVSNGKDTCFARYARSYAQEYSTTSYYGGDSGLAGDDGADLGEGRLVHVTTCIVYISTLMGIRRKMNASAPYSSVSMPSVPII